MGDLGIGRDVHVSVHYRLAPAHAGLGPPDRRSHVARLGPDEDGVDDGEVRIGPARVDLQPEGAPQGLAGDWLAIRFQDMPADRVVRDATGDESSDIGALLFRGHETGPSGSEWHGGITPPVDNSMAAPGEG